MKHLHFLKNYNLFNILTYPSFSPILMSTFVILILHHSQYSSIQIFFRIYYLIIRFGVVISLPSFLKEFPVDFSLHSSPPIMSYIDECYYSSTNIEYHNSLSLVSSVLISLQSTKYLVISVIVIISFHQYL